MEIRVYLTAEARAAGLTAPRRAYPDDAGLDLRALHTVELPPQTCVQVATGLGFEIPRGWYGLICNRTSGGWRGLLPVGHVVDAGYTGEVRLLLHNTRPDQPIVVERNEKVAQIVFMRSWQGQLVEVAPSDVRPTARGDRWLGSSGRE